MSIEPNDPAITNNNSDLKVQQKQNEDAQSGADVVLPAEDLKTWLKTEPVKLRMEASGPLAVRPITIMTQLKETTNKFPDRDALAVKREGKWVKWSYKQYLEEVRIVAKGFIKLGLEPLDAVGILGFNSPEWLLSQLGGICAGGVVMGIYATNSPEACHYVLDDSDASIAVVENDQQLQKILEVRDRLPHLKAIIQWDGQLKEKYDRCYTWAELMEMGRQEEDDKTLEDRIRGQAPNKCCMLCYTSGTTGDPKGAMISHDNLIWTARMTAEYLKLEALTIVSYLPLSHLAAQTTDVSIPLVVGGSCYFAQPDALKGSLVDSLKEIQPTAFLGVPRVWEKMVEKMKEVGQSNSGFKKKIAAWAKDVGYRGGIAKMNGGSLPWGWSIANALVFKKVKAALGLDRCNIFLTGAAPMSDEVYNFFLSLDIPLMDVYGMTETTAPHTANVPYKFRPKTVGTEIPGASTKFCDINEKGSGEICMYGRNVFMGYVNKEDKTREALDEEGWLHSGDLGKKDKDGFLLITGRIKEIIITAGGENIAPVPIEDKVKEELPVVSNCMLIGDKRKFLSMLITLKTEVDLETAKPMDQLSKTALDWCRSIGCTATTVTEILESNDKTFMQAIQQGIDRANDHAISRAQKIQKWTVLPRDFSIPGGEIGPTMKLRRPSVGELKQDIINAFYAGV